MTFNISTRTLVTCTFALLFLFVFYAMGQWMIPFIIGLILAYAFHIPAIKLSKALRISRTFSAAIIIFCLVAICSIFAIFMGPLMKTAAMSLLRKMPHIMDLLPRLMNEIVTKISDAFGFPRSNLDLTGAFSKYARGIIETLPNYISAFVNKGFALMYIVMFVFMTPIVTFYMLKDWAKIEKYGSLLLSKALPEAALNTIKNINTNLGRFITGQLSVCLILAIVYTISLYFIGIQEYVVCGVFSGFMACAPFIGPLISLVVTIVMAIDDYHFLYQYIFTCGLYVVIPFIDSNLLTPKLIGDKIGMQPFWMLFSICATVSVIGTSGVFISVPIAVILSTICKDVFKKI